MTAFLGIDIGTSSTKALTVDANTGDILASASAEYSIQKPQPNYAEQQPDDWWQATVDTVRAVTQQTAAEIAAVGFSGQMHGTVLLDADYNVVHPAIIWADQRTSDTADLMTEQVPDAIQTTGTLPAAGFLGATLVWLREHQPELLSRAAHVLLPKDYIRWRMIGELATDVTDAAGTALFDVHQQQWAEDIIAAYDLPRSIFPPLINAYDVAGELQSNAADELGLPAGIPVVAGCADQPAQAFGNGITRPGLASVTIGSGGQIFMPLPATSQNTDARLHVFRHATGDLYALGAILSAGLSLRWLRDTLYTNTVDDAYAEFSNAAAQVDPGADGLLFLPYLNGERTPHMDGSARGAFIGLSMSHTRGHLARAIMEGVAFALRQAYDIASALDESPETVVISGGGAESAVWRQILTDVFNQPLVKSLRNEQAALGAAMLAAIGSGHYGDDIATSIETARAIVADYDNPTTPHADHAAIYDERYQQFTELYPRLKSDFHKLSKS